MDDNAPTQRSIESTQGDIEQSSLRGAPAQDITAPDPSGSSSEPSATQSTQSIESTPLANRETPHVSLIQRPPQVQAFIDNINALGDHPNRPLVLFQISRDGQAKCKQSKWDINLSIAVDFAYMAITSLHDGDPRLPGFLHNYARALQCI
jgi:hypothetical protein